ncbi:MerR family transcriptional regulator [Streptosporangium sp. NBC_01756]|uniref:MerR family transcriptional regulator n=1 Tax=Streptosporangium sp. NBC_01756 TaxID=2975950 RepID=UPI002DD8E744|nr:MerR family transcriptional regulator [Streptosporangium sp. NBC_01756]WSC88551.1 MerR family transcriptional regulator [Streptosporangium sp. NBC_01756]
MRIGELSRRTGASERLLRYYEEQGLLRPARLPSGYRVYTQADADTVRRIRTLLVAGLNTATIAQVLPCVRDDGERLVPTCSDLLEDLHRERDRITRAMEDLESSRAMLDTVIAAAPQRVAEGMRRSIHSMSEPANTPPV